MQNCSIWPIIKKCPNSLDLDVSFFLFSYNTLKNNYETFALKSEIPKTISAVYSLPQKRKIVILRQELGKLIETEIDEAKLR